MSTGEPLRHGTSAADAEPPPLLSALSPGDLAELVAEFTAVTERLEATHHALRSEVVQLKAELADANQQVARSRRLAALGEMAAGIAHEVRNPLGSIRLYARLLVEDLGDRPEQRRTSEKILGAVSRLDAVVGDVLTFARELKVRPEPLGAEETLRSAVDAARTPGREWEGVEVQFDVAPGLPPLRADAALLHQALVNLIRNAVEAMAEVPGGPRRLKVSARPDEVREPGPAGGAPRRMFCLSIADSGPGVSEEVVARMFNPFFTTRATGTGLGLPIVARIADAHGGRVVVRNNPPFGALSEFFIPQ
jgi:signal transduction histidine kinase